EGALLSFTALLFFIAVATACGVSVNHVQRFSAAGSEYGHAADSLIETALVTHIDADSERLLNQGFPSEGYVSADTRRELYRKHEDVLDLVGTLEELRQHDAALLHQYFDA